jgi:outer membrane lipoprotein LolB
VELVTADQVYRADDAESLTGQVLGWRLPLAGLPYWIQGVHSPVTASEKDLDAEGRVVAVRQDGWEIVYLAYFPSQQVRDIRPRIVTLSRQDLRIKLVVDEWEDE